MMLDLARVKKTSLFGFEIWGFTPECPLLYTRCTILSRLSTALESLWLRSFFLWDHDTQGELGTKWSLWPVPDVSLLLAYIREHWLEHTQSHCKFNDRSMHQGFQNTLGVHRYCWRWLIPGINTEMDVVDVLNSQEAPQIFAQEISKLLSVALRGLCKTTGWGLY